MSKCEDHVKIEAGQILNPGSFPPPTELVCIQVPKVFDQVALRECVHSTETILHNVIAPVPTVSFEGADCFDITGIRVVSKKDSLTKAGFKQVKLSVDVKFKVQVLIGNCTESKTFTATFPLTVNEIYCPKMQVQVAALIEGKGTIDIDGSILKVEALLDAFNPVFTTTTPDQGKTYTVTLTLDVGGFFIVKCENIVQLLIPAYGYCPVPLEQQTINPTNTTCTTFNNRCLTPFPTSFFPDQKWNPLDKGTKEDWDD